MFVIRNVLLSFLFCSSAFGYWDLDDNPSGNFFLIGVSYDFSQEFKLDQITYSQYDTAGTTATYTYDMKMNRAFGLNLEYMYRITNNDLKRKPTIFLAFGIDVSKERTPSKGIYTEAVSGVTTSGDMQTDKSSIFAAIKNAPMTAYAELQLVLTGGMMFGLGAGVSNPFLELDYVDSSGDVFKLETETVGSVQATLGFLQKGARVTFTSRLMKSGIIGESTISNESGTVSGGSVVLVQGIVRLNAYY